jgi:hypothetical protein
LEARDWEHTLLPLMAREQPKDIAQGAVMGLRMRAEEGTTHRHLFIIQRHHHKEGAHLINKRRCPLSEAREVVAVEGMKLQINADNILHQ